MIGLEYQYLFGGLIGLIVFWVPLYVLNPKLRHEMLVMSLMTAPLGPISQLFYTYDYWQPVYATWFPFEDLLFAFIIGGVGGVAYQSLRRYSTHHLYAHKRKAVGIAVLCYLLMLNVLMLLGVPSIYASSALMLCFCGGMLLHRKDLIVPALGGGVLTALVLVVWYYIWLVAYPTLFTDWWYLERLSGIWVGEVPFEEVLWGFAWGCFASVVYEFVFDVRYRMHRVKASGAGV